MSPQDQARKPQKSTSEEPNAVPGPKTATGSESVEAAGATQVAGKTADPPREAAQPPVAQPSKGQMETQPKMPSPAEAKPEGSQSQETKPDPARQKSLAEALRFEQRADSRRRP